MKNFVQKVQKLAETTTQKVQETSETLSHATQPTLETINQTAIQAKSTVIDAANTSKAQVTAATQQTLEAINQTVIEAANTGKAKVEELQETSDRTAQNTLAAVGKIVDNSKTAAMSLGVSTIALNQSLQHLPKTASELALETPTLARRLRSGAGLRLGDSARSDAEVMKLFDKIPGTSKLNVDEATLRQFLADKHGSHILARSQGGSNNANNIVWEVGADNIRRGANLMTPGEQIYIRAYNAVDSILQNSGAIAKLGLQATGTAILTQAIVTAIAYSLDLYRGDITLDEFRDKILAAALSAGIATPLFFLILVGVLALIPELTVVLSAPAVVMGFNALFGASIALPIVQSIVRHIEAGGLGEDVAADYQQATQSVNQLIQTSTDEIRRYCENFTSQFNGISLVGEVDRRLRFTASLYYKGLQVKDASKSCIPR